MMRMKIVFHGVILVLLVSIFPLFSPVPFLISDSQILDTDEHAPIYSLSEGNSEANLTWTSRTQIVPQLLENESIAAGDHVVLNATFPQTQNVTECKLKIWNNQGNVNTTVSCLGLSISLDTYYLDRSNQTYNILVIGNTSTNDSILARWENVSICNFFAPKPTAFYPITDDNIVFNITWTCEERNLNDANYYDVWLSNNDGTSYMLVMRNLTQTWYIWNSTGWFEGIYIARIRAYSVDYSSSECRLNDPPSSYWPGDFGDATTLSFDGGTHCLACPHGYFWLDVEISTNSSYYFGSTGNIITVLLTFAWFYPPRIEYSVTDNGIAWIQDEFQLQSYSDNYSINIDGLSVGYHTLLVGIVGYSSTHYHTCTINVTEPISSSTNPQDWSSLIQALALGVSIGSVTIITVVIILSLRLRRNRAVEYG